MATYTSFTTLLGRLTAKSAALLTLLTGSVLTRLPAPNVTSPWYIHDGSQTSVELNENYIDPTVVSELHQASGITSTQKTPPALSILSPSASDQKEHAKHLRDKYGIPVLMSHEHD